MLAGLKRGKRREGERKKREPRRPTNGRTKTQSGGQLKTRQERVDEGVDGAALEDKQGNSRDIQKTDFLK